MMPEQFILCRQIWSESSCTPVVPLLPEDGNLGKQCHFLFWFRNVLFDIIFPLFFPGKIQPPGKLNVIVKLRFIGKLSMKTWSLASFKIKTYSTNMYTKYIIQYKVWMCTTAKLVCLFILATPVDEIGLSTHISHCKDLGLTSMCICAHVQIKE